MQFNIEKFANNEIELSKGLLEKYPDDETQRNRLIYWLSYLGKFEEAEKIPPTLKSEGIINKFKNATG